MSSKFWAVKAACWGRGFITLDFLKALLMLCSSGGGGQESRVGHNGGFHAIPVLVEDMVMLQVSLQRLVIDELESISYSEGQTCS